MTLSSHYYIGEGQEAEALIADVQARLKAAGEARAALMKEYGTDALITRGRSEKVVGLAFKKRVSRPFLKGEFRLAEGFGYYPRHNCKAGKELAAKFAVPAVRFSVSDYPIENLNGHRTCVGSCIGSRTGLAIYSSVAGFAFGKVLIKIPGDPMTGIPDWLREVKESEWLAAQGK